MSDESKTKRKLKGKSRIMYIEYKGDGITGPGRIGRVFFSKTGNTLYYKDRTFKPCNEWKANYRDIETKENYWFSGCKKNGDDSLYPGVIEVDEDVREEYWGKIRNRPDCVEKSSFRSKGKYSKREPR